MGQAGNPVIAPKSQFRRCLGRAAQRYVRETCGSMIIEAALALPLLIAAMVGMVSYGLWLTAAHSVQEAAHAALAGMDQGEREALVSQSLAHGVMAEGTIDPDLLVASTEQNGAYYTVKIRYDFARSGVFVSGAIPLPDDVIERSAIVKLGPS